MKTFNIADAGNLLLDNISLTEVEAVYKEMVLPSDMAKEQTYNLKNFLCMRLKPDFRLLFDVVHKVILS